ncbi:MAG TPA: 16S rRNA (cytosine(1402)-N(4))-methyltransferase RsmH [Bryobacteraceae bacterium]|nr:16S rRNA (cytosine(1402)-N(4))-methyltransferase RsmH [Bryobacteraceae bacterium]
MHVPVMLGECLEYLGVRPDGIYLDVTAGLGGHAGAIAARLSSGLVIASDRDAESLELAKRNTAQWADRIRYTRGSFAELPATLAGLGMAKVDGVLADLGVSRYQLTEPERGFSLMAEGPLDMRMDRSQGRTADEIVNFSSEKELADLIYQFGEERRSRRISRAIVRARPIHTTQRLSRVIEEAVPRTSKLHPATQTFMALRLAVNDEPGQLDSLLALAPDLVLSGGRIVILSFMSLEDRKVKQCFQALARAGRAEILTRHVVRPSSEEIRTNPPSRSAKLRAVEMKQQ